MNNVLLHFIFGLLGTVAYCYLFHIPKRYYLSCGLIGGVGWLIYVLILNCGLGDTFAGLISTVFVALASRIASVYMECPSTVFLSSSGIRRLVTRSLMQTAQSTVWLM